MRIVLDSNVIISSFHFGGSVREVVDTIIQRGDSWLMSPFILDEVDRVLKDKMSWRPRQRRVLRRWLLSHTTLIQPTSIPVVIAADPDDDNILALAAAGSADVIVSGDTRHVLPLRSWQGVIIVSPHEFLDLY